MNLIALCLALVLQSGLKFDTTIHMPPEAPMLAAKDQTWTFVQRQDGVVRVTGDMAAMGRQFWAKVASNQGVTFCYRPEDAYTASYSTHTTAAVMVIARYQPDKPESNWTIHVQVYPTEEVIVEGKVPEETRIIWEWLLDRYIAQCGHMKTVPRFHIGQQPAAAEK